LSVISKSGIILNTANLLHRDHRERERERDKERERERGGESKYALRDHCMYQIILHGLNISWSVFI
jgi:hypothetical protein